MNNLLQQGCVHDGSGIISHPEQEAYLGGMRDSFLLGIIFVAHGILFPR